MNDRLRPVNTIEIPLPTEDGLTLPGRLWPAPRPCAVLALVHGMGEHGGRYERFASLTNAVGVSLATVDLRGHGRAPGESCWVKDIDDYLLDIDALVGLALTQAQTDGLPWFLMGHSFGGALSVRWLDQRRAYWREAGLRGVVLSSAALQVGADVHPLVLKLAPLAAALMPHARLQPIDPALISRIPEQVAAYRDDPLVAHRPPPARTANELLRLMPRNLAAAANLDLPLLAFHGEADRLTNPAGTRQLVAAWGGHDKTLRLWPGGYHELLNDHDGAAVAAELLGWITARAV